jgi:heptosyltransferase-2
MVKFLVVRFSSIGDIILTTPVLRHLKKQVEGAEIHYLTKNSFATILEANPYVDRVHTYDGNLNACLRILRQEGIDYIIDLHRNIRTARVKFYLKRIDFSVRKLNLLKWLYVNLKINRLPELHLVDRNLATINDFISELDDGGLDYFIPEREEVSPLSLPAVFGSGFVGLAIGAQHETKKLPLDLLIALCRLLRFPVIILGGPGDRETGDEIVSSLPGRPLLNSCGDYTLHQSASLVKQSRVLITHDTGLMHIGAAFRKRVISIWGNTVPQFGMYPYRPDPASLQFEVAGLPCRPCSKIGHDRCPRGHFRCMKEQDLKGIADAANRLFGSTGQ